MRCKVLLCCSLLALVNPVTPTEIWVHPHSSVVLPCSASLSGDAVDPALLGVRWSRNDSTVASAGTAGNYTLKDFRLNPSAFANGTFSLVLRNASLSQRGVYECLVSYNYTRVHASNVSLGIAAPPTLSIGSTVVIQNRESALECRATDFNLPLIYFSWTRAGDMIRPPRPLVATNRTAEGYYWATSTLTFTPTAQDRNATFGCVVNHSTLDEQLALNFNLSVVQIPSITLSAVPPLSRSGPLTLSCDVASFYPKAVAVSWLLNGTALPEAPPPRSAPGGSFRTRRYLTLSATQREATGEVRCAVRQPGVGEASFGNVRLADVVNDLDPVLNKSAKASVALMIISLVLVFLLCFGFSWRRRDEKLKSLTVSAIVLPPRLIVGKKGRVTVSVEGRRVDRVQTSWFLNDTPISDTSNKGTEKGPLLPPGGDKGYYKLHTQNPLRSGTGGTQQLFSSLSFIPQLSVHKGAVFKCQVSYVGKDKVVVERVSGKFTVLAVPEVSEIQLTDTPDDTGIVTLTVRATRFHPDIITFRWFCEGGELCPVGATQALSSPRPDTQGYFSALSQCRLPRAELERGGTRVWVSVHHIALKQPITRETRGFVKKPCVAEIICSPASGERPLTLGCDITGFYPPEIVVTWWRVKGEAEEEIEEPVKGGEIWGPLLTHPRTYRAGATLSDGGEGFERIVCRVEHCELREPVERRWTNSHTAPPSIPASLSMRRGRDGLAIFSIRLSGGHPAPRILWAAGSAALSTLVSMETGERSEEGRAELSSTCALETLPEPPSRGPSHQQSNGYATKPLDAFERRAPISEAEDLTFIDEDVADEEKPSAREKTKRIRGKETVDGEVEGMNPLHINTVVVRKGECLRVCVEITHPALALPVYRTWTDLNEEVSS